MTYQLIVANERMKPARSAPDGRMSGAVPTAMPSVPPIGGEDEDDDGEGDEESDSSPSRPPRLKTGPLHLYIDIETAPSQDRILQSEIALKHTVDLPDYDAIRPDARLTDPAKIEADIAKKRAKALADFEAAAAKAEEASDAEWRKTALDGAHGHLACVSFAFNDRPVSNVRNVCLEPRASEGGKLALGAVRTGEYELLLQLFQQIEHAIESVRLEARYDRNEVLPDTPILVAHHAQFDIRFIWQRAIILGVDIPEWWPINVRPWDTDRVQDTMTLWAGHGNRIGLDRLCHALGIPGKDGIDGSKVWDAIVDGRLDDVVEYCDDDVRRLRSVHRKMQGLAPLEGDEVGVSADSEAEFVISVLADDEQRGDL